MNANLLFAGNDSGLFVTIDSGTNWARMRNVPNVAVRDLALQKRDKRLVAGTYRRGIFVVDIAPLEELSASMLSEAVHLFDTQPTVQRVTWQFGAKDYLFGDRYIVTPNAPDGMRIEYYLKLDVPGKASVTVTDAHGQQVVDLKGAAKGGINTLIWNTHRPRSAGAKQDDSADDDSDPVGQLLPPGD